jgi:glycosyltransferase involved in cell wall biosynthesis
MIDTSPSGGLAHYTYNLCEALCESGVEVRLLTHRDYEMAGFSRAFSLVRTFCREAPYLRSLITILSEYRRFRPEVVHFQTLVSARKDWILFALLRLAGARIVFTAHNVLPHETRLFERTTYAWMYRLSSMVILHSKENQKEFLHRFKTDGAKTIVIPHGSYGFFRGRDVTDRGQARKKIGLPETGGVILFFGAIRPYKGLHTLIEAFGQLVGQGRELYLVIAGKVLVGTEEEYHEAIRQAGVTPRVLFRHEYIPFDEVSDYFAAADVVALPYTHIYDSGVLHIAYALGVPVVATPVGSFLDHVRDGETGLLVRSGGASELAQALARVLEDEDLRRRLGKNAQRYDSVHFGWDGIASRTDQLYREAVNS